MRLLFAIASVLTTALSLPFTQQQQQQQQQQHFKFESPFLPCGGDPSGKGVCLLLKKEVFQSLMQMPVGSKVDFNQFDLGGKSKGVLNLQRFSASEDGDDLDKVVVAE